MIERKEYIKSLVKRIGERDDQAAFEKLFNTYFTWLKSVAITITRKNEDAEEVIEDVFVKLWSMRHKLHQIKNIETYLYTATKNRSYNYVKKFYNGYTVELEEEAVEKHYIISPEEHLIIEELKNKIEKAVMHLPEKCRKVFTMVRYDGHSYKKTAELLNISPKTVENQLGIALKKIKLDLDAYLNDPEANTEKKNMNVLLLPFLIFFC